MAIHVIHPDDDRPRQINPKNLMHYQLRGFVECDATGATTPEPTRKAKPDHKSTLTTNAADGDENQE